MSTLCTVCVQTLSFLYCFMRGRGGGVTTQSWGAISGNMSKKVGRHWVRVRVTVRVRFSVKIAGNTTDVMLTYYHAPDNSLLFLDVLLSMAIFTFKMEKADVIYPAYLHQCFVSFTSCRI